MNLKVNNTGVIMPPQEQYLNGTSLLVLQAMRQSLGLPLQQGGTVREFEHLAPHVTTLDLASKGLTAVPREVFMLPNLQKLGLRDNHLTELPDDLERLEKLEVLNASKNQISTFPRLPRNLKELYLVENHLAVVPDLSGLLLTLVELSENRIVFSAESVFPSTVERLILSENRLEELPDISGLKDLKVLLANDNILSSLPSGMTGLPMWKIELNGNRFEEIPVIVTELPKLKILHMKRNQIAGVPEFMQSMGSLEELCLQGNGISDVCLLPQISYFRW